MNTYSPKVLIAGCNGQVGTALLHHPQAAKCKITACTHTQLDITNQASIEAVISATSPAIIINAAAYTAVDKAEEERDCAIKVNHLGAENLAIAAQRHAIKLIHLSTDYVFDGQKQFPYLENDLTNPINFYGESKQLGEEAVHRACENHLILRVSGIFSEYGHNFFKTILRLSKEQKALRIVNDQITCPTDASDIAAMLYTLINHQDIFGTYHYCSKNPVSWYEFAKAILPHHEITAISTKDYKTAAKRPAYSVLDCSKIKNELNIQQPSWEQAVRKICSKLYI